jgi:hypothetical protein
VLQFQAEMTELTLVSIIVGLGSGLFGSFVTVAWSANAEAKKRKILFLEEQLRLLYGPLHFFCTQNEGLVKHQGKIDKAYTKVFITGGAGAVSDPAVRRLASNEAIQTIGVKNEYGVLIRDNNGQMAEVIQKHWSLIDDADREALAAFVIHHIRSLTEFDKEGTPKMPIPVHSEIGHVIIYESDFTKRIAEQWSRKQARLRELRDSAIDIGEN